MNHAAPPEITVAQIADQLGRKVIMDRLGVKASSISNACAEGRFPASWFAALAEMCADANIECPLSLFSFKGANRLAHQRRRA